MSIRKNVIKACFAAVVAIGLAACGGGSTKTAAELEMERLAAAEMACTDAQGRWNADNTCTSAAELITEAAEMACTSAGGRYESDGTCTSAADVEMERLAGLEADCTGADGRWNADNTCTTAAELVAEAAEMNCVAGGGRWNADGTCSSAADLEMERLAGLEADCTGAGGRWNADNTCTTAAELAEMERQRLAGLEADCTGDGGRWNADNTCTTAAELAEMERQRLAGLEADCTGDGGRWNADNTCSTVADLADEQRNAISAAIMMARTAVPGVDNDSTDSEVSSAEMAIANARKAIADAVNVPATEKTANTNTVDTLENELNRAKMARMEALKEADDESRMAMAATGKALRAALDGPQAGGNALANIAAPTLAATGSAPLAIDAAAGAGALPDATDPDSENLMTGDSAGSLGGWAGTDYAHSEGTGDAMVSNEARVYINKGPGRSQAFSGTGGKYTLIDTAGATQGYVLLGEAATPVTRASAAIFMHSGTQTHQVPSQSDAFYVRGTYDGAPGQFRCAGNCSSTNDGMGTVIALGGTWHFKPDTGAMVNAPDEHYLFYGWWVSKDNEGGPTAASAFTGRVGTDPGDSTDGLDTAVAGNTLTGSATYAGHAAGKFAISNPLDDTGNGGHFTADAMLTAKFGDPTSVTDSGMTGTIDNFRLNDGSEDPGWSVSLHRSGWAADGVIAAPTDDATTTDVNEAMGTTWSIGDTSGGRSGTWSGQMYDETPGDPSASGPGDGSNIPTTVTGTFYSEFSSIGRMVGAFGADKE